MPVTIFVAGECESIPNNNMVLLYDHYTKYIRANPIITVIGLLHHKIHGNEKLVYLIFNLIFYRISCSDYLIVDKVRQLLSVIHDREIPDVDIGFGAAVYVIEGAVLNERHARVAGYLEQCTRRRT